MFIKSANNRGPRSVQALFCKDESKTVQSEEKSANINNIFAQIEKTGMIVMPVSKAQALVGDFSNPMSYQEMKDLVLKGLDAFMTLPAKIRERFQNDPDTWLKWMDNKDNLDEMIALGVLTRKEPDPEPPITRVEVVKTVGPGS